MNDYEEIMNSAKYNIVTQIDRAYHQGYADAKSEKGQNVIDLAHKEIDRAYQRGLNDAWEAARKLMLSSTEGGLEPDIIAEIFDGLSYYMVLKDVSASEAVAKIKEYEEQQKQDAEIKVGDQVITAHGGKGIVITNIASEEGMISVWIPTCTHVQMYPLKNLSKTGRTYPQIAEVLEKMRGDKE